ncbi:hypothetical protein [Solimonas soli]|uniref:hypothetical protein n=1 Tax=Solimonas soli TaxID=413479 RepID=UPI000485B275|nr:hypothetical protein [Solimonas soli]
MMFAAGLGPLWHFGGEHCDFGLRPEMLDRDVQTGKSAHEREGVAARSSRSPPTRRMMAAS